jgi:1-acyl-sn-glycerol-3-phosphate acyltransferase
MNISPLPRRTYPSDRLTYDLCWRWSRALATVLGRARVHNLDRLPAEGPVLVAANHSSYLDPVFVGCVITRPTRYMAKDALFRGPLGVLLPALGAFPVKRGKTDPGAIRTAMRVLKDGQVLVLFPEGTRGEGEDLLDAQKGVGFLATRMGATVVPCYLDGVSEVLGRGQRWFRRRQVEIVFGEPRVYGREHDPGEAAEEVVAELRNLRASMGSLRLDRGIRVR